MISPLVADSPSRSVVVNDDTLNGDDVMATLVVAVRFSVDCDTTDG